MLDRREALKRHNEMRALTEESLLALAELADARSEGQESKRGATLRETAERLRSDRFTLAVVGEFSRGKSTLINALLGCEELLPTALEPSTAAVTVLTHGTPAATVHFEEGQPAERVPLEKLSGYILGRNLDGESLRTRVNQKVARFRRQQKLHDLTVEDIESEVAEELGAEPGAAVELVELAYPSRFLEDGIRLVDTPGIGSINPRHGEMTRRFIREADAVVFLINTDPVISASECNFLTFLQDYVSHFLFVVTKIDRFSEADRERSLQYTRDTIVEFADIRHPRIFPVSATLALEAEKTGDETKLEASGFPAFVAALDEFLLEGRGHRLVKEYVAVARSHLRELRQAAEVELQGIDLDLAEIDERVEKSRPVLDRACATHEQLLTELDTELAQVQDLILGPGGTDWMRLTTTVREEVFAQLDQCDWDLLKEADQTIPIFVKEIVGEELKGRLDQIASHLGELRDRTIKLSRTAIENLNESVAFEFGDLGEISEDEFSFELDRETFRTSLTQVNTLTIGSTVALAVATGLLLGGIGALVMVGGGVLAGTGVSKLFQQRARQRLKEALEEPLDDFTDHLLENLALEVTTHLRLFRDNVDAVLGRAIGSVEESIQRLQEEKQSAQFNAPERKQELELELSRLTEIETRLQEAQFFSA